MKKEVRAHDVLSVLLTKSQCIKISAAAVTLPQVLWFTGYKELRLPV